MRQSIPDELWNAAADLRRDNAPDARRRRLQLQFSRARLYARIPVIAAPLGVSDEVCSVDVEDAESDFPSALEVDDGFVFMRVSDLGPNSSRLGREREAFFC